MARSRDVVRAQKERIRSKVIHYIRDILHDPERLNEDTINHLISTHMCPCSCAMCGNPRKYFKQLTKKERMAREDLINSLGEIYEHTGDTS